MNDESSAATQSQINVEPSYRYDAFICYRRQKPDSRWAIRLRRSLRNFRTPRRVVKGLGVPGRLSEIFLDRDSFVAGADLDEQTRRKLEVSRTLIVLTSPRAVGRPAIDKEIEYFKQLGRRDNIYIVRIEGEYLETLPEPLREGATAPLDVGIRTLPWRHVVLKLVAALLPCDLEMLTREDARRLWRMWAAASAATLAIVGMVWFLLWQNQAEVRESFFKEVGDRSRKSISFTLDGRPDEGLFTAVKTAAFFLEKRDRDDSLPAILEESLSRSLHGNTLVARSPADASPTRRVRLVPDGSNLLAVGQDGRARVFSPDMQELVTLSAPGGLAKIVDARVHQETTPRALTWGLDNEARIFDLTSGERVQGYRNTLIALDALRKHRLNDARLFPDRKRLVTWGTERIVRIFEVASGKVLREIGPLEGLGGAHLSSEGNRLALVLRPGTVRVLDASSGNWETLAEFASPGAIWKAEASPTGPEILLACDDGVARVFNWKTEATQEFPVWNSRIEARWSPDGRRILASYGQGSFKLFDVETSREIAIFTTPYLPMDFRFHPLEWCVLIVSHDNRIELRSLDGRILRSYGPPASRLTGVDMTEDGSRFVSWQLEEGFALHDTFGGVPERSRQLVEPAAACVFSDGGDIVLGFGSGTAALLDPRDFELGKRYGKPLGRLDHLSISDDGTRVLLASGIVIKMFDRATGRELAACEPTNVSGPEDTTYVVSGAEFVGDGSTFLSVAQDSDAVLVGEGGEVIRRFAATPGELTGGVFHRPATASVFLVGQKGTLRELELETGDLRTEQKVFERSIDGSALTKDRKRVLLLGDFGKVKVLRLSDFKELLSLDRSSHWLVRGAFSPDGSRAVVIGKNGLAEQHSLDGEPMIPLEGHPETLLHASYSPDGTRVATACEDGLIRVFETTSGDLVRVYSGHVGRARFAVFHPREETLLSAGDGGRVLLWDLTDAGLLRAAVERARSIAPPETRDRLEPAFELISQLLTSM